MQSDDTFFMFIAAALQRIVLMICLTILLWNAVPTLDHILTSWIAAAYSTGAAQ